jgi:putative chitinase
MEIDLTFLVQICPNTRHLVLDSYVDPLNKIMDEFEINKNNERVAAFISQCAHESSDFNIVKENLNYSIDGLRSIFPSHFRDDEFSLYARNPEMIANRVYANRMGNGPESSGDGWRYRGRGLIQLTGKYNYEICGSDLGMSLEEMPSYLETPEGAVEAAGWFWNKLGLNHLADTKDMVSITYQINGGQNGLKQRKYLFDLAYSLLTL